MLFKLSKLLIQIVFLIFSMGCVRLTDEQKEIKECLDKTVDLSMINSAFNGDSIYNFSQLRLKYDFISIVPLQAQCESCHKKIKEWKQKISMMGPLKKYAVIFIVNGVSHSEFVNDLKGGDPNSKFYIAMYPENSFRQKNQKISEKIIQNSFLINKTNRIVLIGAPFSSNEMKSLFFKTCDF